MSFLDYLSPAYENGVDMLNYSNPLFTNLGNLCVVDPDGTITGNFSGDATEYCIIRVFDDSTGNWHVQSGDTGIRVYVLTQDITYRDPDADLQVLLDPGANRTGVLIGARIDAGEVSSYYCHPVLVTPGRARWIDVTKATTNAAKAASILAQLAIPAQPDQSLIG